MLLTVLFYPPYPDIVIILHCSMWASWSLKLKLIHVSWFVGFCAIPWCNHLWHTYWPGGWFHCILVYNPWLPDHLILKTLARFPVSCWVLAVVSLHFMSTSFYIFLVRVNIVYFIACAVEMVQHLICYRYAENYYVILQYFRVWWLYAHFDMFL